MMKKWNIFHVEIIWIKEEPTGGGDSHSFAALVFVGDIDQRLWEVLVE